MSRSPRIICGLLALVAVVLWAPPAAAHAVLLESDPVNGSALAGAPRAAVLTFSEHIAARFSSARLVDASGRVLGGARATARGDRLTVELPRLAVGAYGIAWRVLAEDDGHTTDGVVVFTIGSVPSAVTVPARVSGPEPFDVVLRWVRLCLLAGLVGGLAVAGLVLRRTVPPVPPDWWAAARHRLLTLAAACAALGVAADLAELAGKPLATQWGRLWFVRTVALALLAVCALVLRRSMSVRRVIAPVTVAAVIVAVSAEAWGGHAAALGGLTIAADAVHILTACLWLGSVAALGVLLAARAGHGLALVRAYRAPFARLALTGAVLVGLTGLFHAASQIGSADALLTSPYGRTLLVKGGIVAVVAALGLANALRSRPSGRLLVAEAGAGAVLLLAAGVLAETSPARPAAVGPAVARSRSANVADLVIGLSVTPNRAGVNGFTVTAASSRRPAPAPIDGVTLELPKGGIVLRRLEPGRYFGTGSLELSGPARLTVVVYRAGARLEVPMTWSVG
ncbi:copper resistance CopC/CopD family protein [Sphaerisporangium perillae]|uniref:copper resistance CopC/CopD family protein n=1 Tax=Sphaerisporangium perillae TaxID=2935860 RepID=UPI00200EE2AA|nr:copper resistance protein CopC [Sphaerisporangium perillae]